MSLWNLLIIQMMSISNEIHTPPGTLVAPQHCSKTCVFLCQVNTRSVFLFFFSFFFIPPGSVILAKVVSTAKAMTLCSHEQLWSPLALGRQGEARWGRRPWLCCQPPAIVLCLAPSLAPGGCAKQNCGWRHEGRAGGRNGDACVASLPGDFGFSYSKGGQQWGDRPLRWGYTATQEHFGKGGNVKILAQN